MRLRHRWYDAVYRWNKRELTPYPTWSVKPAQTEKTFALRANMSTGSFFRNHAAAAGAAWMILLIARFILGVQLAEAQGFGNTPCPVNASDFAPFTAQEVGSIRSACGRLLSSL